MLAKLTALLPLVALLSATFVHAQDKSADAYPMWVTNDYKCVIGCLQIFDDKVTDRPSPSTEQKGNQCIIDTCDKASMGMNIYQAHYIIQMFYATGSIYEDPNMGDWGSGTPPDKQVLAANAGGSLPVGDAPSAPPSASQGGPTQSGTSSASTAAANKPSGGSNSTGGTTPESAAERTEAGLGWLSASVAAAVLGLAGIL